MPSNIYAATVNQAWKILQHCPELGWSKANLQGYKLIMNEHAIAAFSIVLDEAELLLVATHPDYRQQGYAYSLLQASIASLPVKTIFLEVRASNFAAQKLYHRLGFTKINERKSYYHTPEENALIYKLNLK